MSSTIRIKRVCHYCNKEFIARTTVTKCCSDICAKRFYKSRLRDLKLADSNNETQKIKLKNLELIKSKEFLTVRDVSKLFNCSPRTIYRTIKQNKLKAVNISERKTLIKRSDIDHLFS